MKNVALCLACLALVLLAVPAHAAPGFTHVAATFGAAPVPAAEHGLQTVVAEPLKTVNSERHVLEGAVFDDEGNLYFCDVTGGKVQKLTQENALSDHVVLDGLQPCGLAFGPDGLLYMAVKNPEGTAGSILAVAGPGAMPRVVVGAEKGYLPNDLAFDGKGGLYFSDCKGSSTVTGGGIVYLAPDGATLTTVIPAMAQANGVALSPDDSVIWATEYAREQLHKTEVRNATEVVPFRSHIPYRFTGRGPDSIRTIISHTFFLQLTSVR